MGVEPKIGGKPPKWMVYFMENPIRIHDLGGFPINFGRPPIFSPVFCCPSIWQNTGSIQFSGHMRRFM